MRVLTWRGVCSKHKKDKKEKHKKEKHSGHKHKHKRRRSGSGSSDDSDSDDSDASGSGSGSAKRRRKEHKVRRVGNTQSLAGVALLFADAPVTHAPLALQKEKKSKEHHAKRDESS